LSFIVFLEILYLQDTIPVSGQASTRRYAPYCNQSAVLRLVTDRRLLLTQAPDILGKLCATLAASALTLLVTLSSGKTSANLHANNKL
jgi:hypothetical protein